MHTVLPVRVLEEELIRAPACSPLMATWPATMPGGFPFDPTTGPPAERTACRTVGNAKTQAIASATMSAGRSSDGDLCRRRVRAGTLAGFAIGRVILVVATAPHIRKPLLARRLLDPAVLRGGDFLACGRVDVDHGKDDSKRLVLPERYVERLVGNRLVQHQRVGGKTGLGPLDRLRATRAQIRCAEAEQRIVRVSGRCALLIFELDDEIHDHPVGGDSGI